MFLRGSRVSQVYLFELASHRTQWLSTRQQLIAGNVANANTPQFRAQDLKPFSAVLDQTQFTMTTTNPAHITPPETELAAERAEWGHGAFSLALIEGLSGKADLLHKSAITVSALDYYIAERVKELTNGAQHPVMSRPDTVPDFAFATTR